MTSPVFDTYSRYYDLLYRDKDYATEAEYVQRILGQHGVAAGRLLEFGSGTGRHGRLLGDLGYRVHGIERSAEMVALAEQTRDFSCEVGDVRVVKLGQTYDAVISLFHVVSYQTSNEDVNAIFARASDHLNSDGLFAFDFWYSPAVYAQRPAVRVKRMLDDQTEITRIAEPTILPNQNLVDVTFEIFARDLTSGVMQTLKETHPMRHFSLPEIDLLSSLHGFERVFSEEFLTGKPPGEDTWGVCVVLRKA